MYAFNQHRPTTVRQAASLLAKQEEAKLLAGGHTLIPTMKLRLAGPKNLVDLSTVEGLTGIEVAGRSVTIGAMTLGATFDNIGEQSTTGVDLEMTYRLDAGGGRLGLGLVYTRLLDFERVSLRFGGVMALNDATL